MSNTPQTLIVHVSPRPRDDHLAEDMFNNNIGHSSIWIQSLPCDEMPVVKKVGSFLRHLQCGNTGYT
jgi:hypothetical protein